MVKAISILGSTGSVGESTLDICRQHPDRFRVVALSAHQNIKKLAEQIQEFSPKVVSVQSRELAESLKHGLPQSNVLVHFGAEGLNAVATHPDCELVVSAIVGAAGLVPTHQAIASGKHVALANKESLIVAGSILTSLAKKNNVRLIPVDSEHSAIFQCLQGEDPRDVQKLILTASGGPFWQTPIADFKRIKKEDALKHPCWNMGAKISVDSATLMNKGLEVIEAGFLFNMPVQNIEVVVHPQSVIHSMVELIDGSTLAQMGEPDMRGPIAYALSYPRRLKLQTPRLDLPKREQLTFFAPDLLKFPCLQMAFEVAGRGQSYVPVLNAANEVLVSAFLDEKIPFVAIPALIEQVLAKHSAFALHDLPDVFAADAWARTAAQTALKTSSC